MSNKLIQISPITAKQKCAFDAYSASKNLFLYGSAKTGKTYLALYFALLDLFEMKRGITIVRSAVPTREVGFLKGTLEEKTAVYETPYRDIVGKLLLSYAAYDNLKNSEELEFLTTSYVRGLTLGNRTIIIDECQNLSLHEIDSLMTRMGHDVRVIFCGDAMQADLAPRETGFRKALQIIKGMDCFECIEFFPDDIVGSELAKQWLLTKYALAAKKDVPACSPVPKFLNADGADQGGEVLHFAG